MVHFLCTYKSFLILFSEVGGLGEWEKSISLSHTHTHRHRRTINICNVLSHSILECKGQGNCGQTLFCLPPSAI